MSYLKFILRLFWANMTAVEAAGSWAPLGPEVEAARCAQGRGHSFRSCLSSPGAEKSGALQNARKWDSSLAARLKDPISRHIWPFLALWSACSWACCFSATKQSPNLCACPVVKPRGVRFMFSLQKQHKRRSSLCCPYEVLHFWIWWQHRKNTKRRRGPHLLDLPGICIVDIWSKDQKVVKCSFKYLLFIIAIVVRLAHLLWAPSIKTQESVFPPTMWSYFSAFPYAMA